MSKNSLFNSINTMAIFICCFALIIIYFIFLYTQFHNTLEGMESKSTFKLKDIITNKYISINRNTNKSFIDTYGIDFYIDNSSNTIINVQSGAVGLIDYANDNYMQQLNDTMATTNKLVINPVSLIKSSDFLVGNLNFSWIFCASNIASNYYSIYNTGKWLNIGENDEITFNNNRRLWCVEGNNKQVSDNAIKYVISLEDVASGKSFNIDRLNNSAILTTYPAYFMFNNNIVNSYYDHYKTYIIQDMYDGYCLTSLDDIVVSEEFSMENPTFGWLFFKTNSTNIFNIYNRSKNYWIHSDGTNVTSSKTPSKWKIIGDLYNNINISEPAYKLQDNASKKYINIDYNSGFAFLDDKGCVFCDVFVNNKDATGGQYICDISTCNYLSFVDNNVIASGYDSSNSNNFIFSLFNKASSQDTYTIFKVIKGVTRNDVKNAKYLDTNDNGVVLQTNKTGQYKEWNKVYVSSMKEGFSNIIENFGVPSADVVNRTVQQAKTGPVDNKSIINSAQNANMGPPGPDSLSSAVQKADFSGITNMIPDSPGGGKPDAGGIMNTIMNTVSNITMPTTTPITSIYVENQKYGSFDPYHSFKTPANAGINVSSSVDNVSQTTNQYIKASLSGDFKANNTNQATPLGKRFFVDTKSTCNKKDGTGNVTRYYLVDTMKYMKYPDGNANMGNYGLLYSAAGSLQEIDANTLLSQFKDIDNPGSDNNLCVNVEIDLDGRNQTFDSKYVTISDCKKIDAIAFKNGEKKCENFENYEEEKQIIITDDIVTKFYFTSVTAVCLLILYRLMNR